MQNDTSNNLNSQGGGARPAPGGIASLTRMLRILFFCFLTLIIAVFVYYFIFSGIFRVDEQYEAMLMRFGVLQYRSGDGGNTPILASGKWYWSYPYPVDEVIMVPANKSVSVSTENTFKAWIAPTGAAIGAPNRELRTGVDGYVVAADMHIFHVEWVVSYKVKNAEKYYLDFYDDGDSGAENNTRGAIAKPGIVQAKEKDRLRGHQVIIRNLLSDAVLSETASWVTEDLIKASRTVGGEGQGHAERIEERVRSLLEEKIDRIGLGIEVQSVTLLGLYQPPAAALQAFNSVNASERNKQTAIQNAQAYANTLLTQANANRERIVGEATAYQETIVRKMQAEAQYFEAILAEYKQNPKSTLTVLYTEALEQTLASVPVKYVLHTDGEGATKQLRLQIAPPPAQERDNQAGAAAAPQEPASAQP